MRRKSAAVRRRMCGRTSAKPIIRSNFASSRTVRQLRVVAVLLAPARVPPRGLQVAVWISADPHVLPRRRNHERTDARQLLPIRQPSSGGGEVAERRVVPHAADACAAIGDVAQTRRASTLRRGGRGLGASVVARSAACGHDVSGAPAHSKSMSTGVSGLKQPVPSLQGVGPKNRIVIGGTVVRQNSRTTLLTRLLARDPRRAALEQRQHRGFGLFLRHLQQRAVEVRIEHVGVDVALSADGLRISQALRDILDRADDVSLGFGL